MMANVILFYMLASLFKCYLRMLIFQSSHSWVHCSHMFALFFFLLSFPPFCFVLIAFTGFKLSYLDFNNSIFFFWARFTSQGIKHNLKENISLFFRSCLFLFPSLVESCSIYMILEPLRTIDLFQAFFW